MRPTIPPMASKIPVDLLAHARWILPIRPSADTVLSHHSLAVKGGRIVDILPSQQATRKYNAAAEVHRPRHAVMPGLINTHTHSGMTLMRGCADDSTLHDWLHGRVWPIEGAFTKEESFCHDGALLAAAEMTRGGTTTFSDMYWNVDAAAEVVLKTGMRGVLGICVIGFPSAFGDGPADYMRRGEEARAKYVDETRLSFAYCPHAPYTVDDEAWKMITKRALETNTLIHTHIHETEAEVKASLALDRSSEACHLSDHASRPLANLERLGVLEAKVTAAHMVHLDAGDVERSRTHNVNVAHCPTSNAKLGSGFCDVGALVAAGVNVALGTDSACSNNSLDMFGEMRMAALCAKNVARDARVVDAATALEMATINGAKALGLEANVGSLETGKCADFISVEIGTHAANTPVFCPQSALVYAASRTDVCDVFVDGVMLVKDKKLLKIDENELVERAQKWADRIEAKFPLDKPAVSDV